MSPVLVERQASERPVSIRLTIDQTTQIVREVAARSPLLTLRARFLQSLTRGEGKTSGRELYSDRRLSRTMLQGLMVLLAFCDEQEHTVDEIATRLDISTSAAYRLARTWAAVRVLELDVGSGSFRLVNVAR